MKTIEDIFNLIEIHTDKEIKELKKVKNDSYEYKEIIFRVQKLLIKDMIKLMDILIYNMYRK